MWALPTLQDRRSHSNHRPTSGTLTLDLDGNGLGWFIDPTSWDNSEFKTQNSGIGWAMSTATFHTDTDLAIAPLKKILTLPTRV
jgi:hypothetical protein